MNSQHANPTVPTVLTPVEATPAPQANGSSAKISTWSGSRLPSSSSPGKKARRFLNPKVLIPVVAVLALAGAGAGYLVYGWLFRQSYDNLLTHTVQYERLELTITERGQVEASENGDVICRVKAKNPQSSTSSSIKWVIEDGSAVKGPRWIPEKMPLVAPTGLGVGAVAPALGYIAAMTSMAPGYHPGDLLVELDDSGWIDQWQTQQIKVDEARGLMIKAQEEHNIQESQNKSDVETARVELELAVVDLEKYIGPKGSEWKEGEYKKLHDEALGKILVAESNLEMAADRAVWARRMSKKGFLTSSQAQSDEFKLQSNEVDLRRLKNELEVLEKYTKKRDFTEKNNKVQEAERKLDRAKKTAHAKAIQTQSEMTTKTSIYKQEWARLEEMDAEIRKCKLYAPQDGIVVYFVPAQARMGIGSQQSIVQQGESVREGQKLMQIPNLRKMLVKAKVHEAMVGRVKTGQPATVRVDAFPNRVFKASVSSVATIASQQDWFSQDVRVYETSVNIDEVVEGIKPSMNAVVTITTGHPLDHVLTIPVQAVVGSVDLGKHRKCFVLTARGPEERDIVLGMSNDRMVEVSQGLREGDHVVINPKVVVGDKMKTRTGNGDKPQGEQASGDTGEKKAEGASTPPAAPAKEGGAKPAAAAPAGAKPEAGDAKKEGGQARGQRPQGQVSEAQQKQMREWFTKFQKATPAQRKDMLQQLPDQYREQAKTKFKEQGFEIAD